VRLGSADVRCARLALLETVAPIAASAAPPAAASAALTFLVAALGPAAFHAPARLRAVARSLRRKILLVIVAALDPILGRGRPLLLEAVAATTATAPTAALAPTAPRLSGFLA
jgi:hypothetical protein